MSEQNISQSSLQSISIKLTESNLPSATIIKMSQQHISLTYTLSIENMSDQRIQIPDIIQSQNLMNSIQSRNYYSESGPRYRKILSKQDNNQTVVEKDVFKKKSILKISNLDFSSMLNHDKSHQSPVLSKAKKTFIKSNNSGLFSKTKSPKNNSMIQTKIHSNSKEIFIQDSNYNPGENLFMRTTRFYSLKNDKIMEAKSGKKGPIRKQFERRIQNSETDRKYNKLPIIKGSNFHWSVPASMSQRRKVFSCYQNAQIPQKQFSNLTEKMILGKSYKISQNDQKAKKYLQKIIQNRNSILHFCENRSNKISKDFKQNIEDFY